MPLVNYRDASSQGHELIANAYSMNIKRQASQHVCFPLTKDISGRIFMRNRKDCLRYMTTSRERIHSCCADVTKKHHEFLRFLWMWSLFLLLVLLQGVCPLAAQAKRSQLFRTCAVCGFHFGSSSSESHVMSPQSVETNSWLKFLTEKLQGFPAAS